jgi:two-component sensor histidine kinase
MVRRASDYMPSIRASGSPGLEERIGRALLREHDDEGSFAVEAERVVACSSHAAKLLGWDADAVVGAPIQRLVERFESELLRLRFQSALLESAAVEFVAPRPGRVDAWINVRTLPLEPGVCFLVKDVTENELSELALRRKEQRLLAANRSLRLAHVAAHAASWEWRHGRSIRWLDLAAARDLASLPPAWIEQEEILDWRTIVPPGGERRVQRGVRRLVRRGEASFELEVEGADHAHHWMRIECAVTERDAGGSPVRVSGVTVDVTAARAADEALRAEVDQRRRSEQRQQMLLHELNHRVKNMLATVQSIARQSLSGTNLGGAQDFEERLMALAWTYEIITREQWAGASLREVIQRTMAPHVDRAGSRLSADGPDLWLSPNRALSIALAMHELATNAVKYGALSNGHGRVSVAWRVTPEAAGLRLELEWVESGGPPVAPPRRRGFGSRLVERSLAHDLNGEVILRFDPEGLRCYVTAPVPDDSEALGA